MIDVIFNTEVSNTAAVSGAWQFDKGQKMRILGLMSPQDFLRAEGYDSDDLFTMQVQFAYVGDSQTQMRLALYDESLGVYTAEVPDEYLTRHKAVNVFIYASFGAEQVQAETVYYAQFTPASRAAPQGTVTPEQIDSWNALVGEVNLAIQKTNAAASAANESAQASKDAQDTMIASYEAQQKKWTNAQATVSTLDPGSDATVSMTDDGEKKVLQFGIPRGEKGDKGDKGDTGAAGPQGPVGPAGVSFSLSGSILTITTAK